MQITQNSEPREIDLWCIFSRGMSDGTRAFQPKKAADGERQKELHFCFTHDHRRYVMSRASIQTTSSKSTEIASEKATFTFNRCGWPEISIGYSIQAPAVSLSILRQAQQRLENWTLTKVYMRVKGGGVCIPVRDFSFYLPHPESVQLPDRAKFSGARAHWRYWKFSTGSRHLIAEDASRARFEVPRLVLREIVPS